MPTRFGFDTRRPQFSSLIVTNQMSREDAIKRLKNQHIRWKKLKKILII